jgi:hypothetical protein
MENDIGKSKSLSLELDSDEEEVRNTKLIEMYKK